MAPRRASAARPALLAKAEPEPGPPRSERGEPAANGRPMGGRRARLAAPSPRHRHRAGAGREGARPRSPAPAPGAGARLLRARAARLEAALRKRSAGRQVQGVGSGAFYWTEVDSIHIRS